MGYSYLVFFVLFITMLTYLIFRHFKSIKDLGQTTIRVLDARAYYIRLLTWCSKFNHIPNNSIISSLLIRASIASVTYKVNFRDLHDKLICKVFRRLCWLSLEGSSLGLSRAECHRFETWSTRESVQFTWYRMS